jgi:hypothetical protein
VGWALLQGTNHSQTFTRRTELGVNDAKAGIFNGISAAVTSSAEESAAALQRRDARGLAHILRTHLRRKREEVVQAGFAEGE